jgi:hypothetical protein
MKIKLISRMAGPDGNYPPGSVIDVEEDKAIRLVSGGYAEALEPVAKPESAPKKETSVKAPAKTPERSAANVRPKTPSKRSH